MRISFEQVFLREERSISFLHFQVHETAPAAGCSFPTRSAGMPVLCFVRSVPIIQFHGGQPMRRAVFLCFLCFNDGFGAERHHPLDPFGDPDRLCRTSGTPAKERWVVDGGKRTASLLRSDADIVSADGTLIFPLLPMNAGGRIMPAGLIRFFGKSSVPGEEVAVFERRRLHLLSRRSERA